MRASTSVRRHAAVVAAIATAIGTACFIALVMILSLLLINHSNSQIDARLHQRLEIVRQVGNKSASDSETSAVASTGGQDSDDVPIYVWRVRANDSVVAYSLDAPKLPHLRWSARDTTIAVANSTFRFSAISYRGGWLIAGESLAEVARLKSILLVLDISVGAVLAILMFLAAFVVGIRAQAPIALAQRRQHEFTSDASHELRTPLSVIEAEVDVALSQSRDGNSYRATLSRIKDEGHRLQRIVEDLLWLARSDEDRKVSLESVTTDVAAIADSSSQRFERLALAHGIALNYSKEGDDAALVSAPADAIDRLIGVLVDNACKFAGDGGQVNVTVTTLSSRTILRVDDSGPGIPSSERDLIFNRFQHSDSSPSGTGLGLAIANAIILSSHAQCLIAEADLGGARFEISWPRVIE
ncbi:MAG TPA: HAMP domain-containing sensor histidine kinase [Acidimicrobiales bacterium]